MFVLKPELKEEEREEVLQKIIKKIASLGGKALASKIWANERNLAFFLKGRGSEKKKYHKGCYWLINFTLETEKLPDLKETIKLEERVLRNIFLKREKSKIDKIVS
jgi:ribosomal protein S6